jgi:DNA-binding FadR family transcriptional regulator
MTARFQSIAPGARLADQVADALAAEVRSGRLSEGDRLPTETALAGQFGVSRTVVREAVSRLKSLGLVDSRQGSGVYVRAAGVEPLRFEMPHVASREAVIQMVELRRALEAEVAGLAAERRTKADLRRIREAIKALQAAVKAGGNGADEDVRFHTAIAEAARNPFLLGTLQYLRQFLRQRGAPRRLRGAGGTGARADRRGHRRWRRGARARGREGAHGQRDPPHRAGRSGLLASGGRAARKAAGRGLAGGTLSGSSRRRAGWNGSAQAARICMMT